ncbi:MAG: DUF1624 domain-containing protein [Acidobacteriota bacterium]|nr:DUF1624 domain-containing protein [Acidobacteriota bacterium]
MEQQKKPSGRLAFIDWTRGLGAVIMLQGHTFDSFTRTDLRKDGPFMLSQFLGGMPPAIFLFLTGITFAFLMHSQERKGNTAWERVLAALKRSRYLFLIAFLFRIQLYVFGFPTSPVGELLRVDILNCMGFAMLIMAPMAVFTSTERVRLCLILGLVIAGLSPVVSLIPASNVPWILRSYLFPSYSYFGFFPWAAFLAFGLAMGSMLRVIQQQDLARAMQWTLAIGLCLTFGAYYFSNYPYSIYTKSEFWLNSPSMVLIKLGVVLIMLPIAYLWVNLAGEQNWSMFRQLGVTSLLVYWVHIELVYGRWFGIWKEGMSIAQVVIYTIILLALITALSVLRTRIKSVGSFFRPSAAPQAESASSD